MGSPSASVTDRLGPYLRTLGMVSVLLAGLGFLLQAVSVYVDEGYYASKSVPLTTSDAIWVALASVLLVISLIALVASVGLKRGVYPSKAVSGILLLAAISLILEGGGMFAYTTSGLDGWGVSAALAVAAGVVLLIAMFISMGFSIGMRVTGGVLAISSVVLLIVRNAALNLPFNNGYSLNSLLLQSSTSIGYAYGFYYAAPALVALGIIGFSYLVYIAFLFVAIGLLFRAFLHGTKLLPIAWVIALVGFLLYGIDMAWGNISALSSTNYNRVNLTTALLPASSAVILSICAFVIIATSIVGMVFYGGGIVGPNFMQAPVAQPGPAQTTTGQFCPKCGAQNPAENLYCRKCGAKLN